MKTPIIAGLTILVGGIVGGGAAFGTDMVLKQISTSAAASELPAFVPTGRILAPLVFPDGRLSGYVSIEAQLQVAPDKAEFVTERLPLLLHAVNMRTYRSPMASGPDGMLPDLAQLRRLMTVACTEAFGADVVKVVAITQAAPA